MSPDAGVSRGDAPLTQSPTRTQSPTTTPTPTGTPTPAPGDEALSTVRALLARVLECDPASIQPATTLAALDADSLVLVELADLLEERYADRNLTIADAELDRLVTVADAVDLLAAQLPASQP
jgi:acyl carrier protein